MDAFSPIPPSWTKNAVHSLNFHCPSCKKSVSHSIQAWINRQAPVMGENYDRKWQEFYQCECEKVWWAWSSDRSNSPLKEEKN
jgi:hypothetical protein